ncbi:MAG TPA: MarP family serine protease [Candidatus Dormibacteraeota bacterium]|nr:MarP family serine protease [Candidatus Dormibacteraeota bacterium]
MNVVDLLAIVLVVLAALAGLRSGALPQLGGLAGAALGAAVGLTVLPLVRDALLTLDPLPRAVAVLGGLLVAIGLGEGLGSSLGRVGARAIGPGILDSLDRAAGAVVGAAQGLLVIWLVGGLLLVGPFPGAAAQANRSAVLRALGFLPAPTDVAGEVARVLDASGLPDVFVGFEPLPIAPPALPSDPQIAAIGRLGIPSTVKLVSDACGAILSGTGVTVAQGYVVTNAHVVAGASGTRAMLADRSFDATPVLFDPSLDVALLRVPGLPSPALRFAASDPGGGAVGAAIGFPNGGPLTVVGAAVSRRMDAVGRDIYDSGIVTRQVLELHAAIQRGDSGGPFVLPDGTIGGLVFAEARTEPDVGYALTPTEVAVRVQPAIGRTSPVATGACTR